MSGAKYGSFERRRTSLRSSTAYIFPSSLIIRTESTTLMDAELVQRSKEIRQRLTQLGDSL
ncbi:hypothetical protein LF1_33760 [Rubripirellula obstinata]|uniref:Uncharacterized protein n=1 Tax=Rubripirellula obstinata TaxID=406547 RepID=A0A5B1CNI9_9BACT|nr:hypothetical protein LF1_33760 [Rubripirellula obstinata]